MSFSFNTTAGASQSTSKPKLEGNNIYEVKFDGCERQDIVGVKDPTMTYKVLKLKFSNDDGTFEHTVFEPRQEDFNRRENEIQNKKTGATEKIPQPSNVESMMLLFKHLIDAVVPSVGKEIDEKKKSLGASNWEDLRTLVENIFIKGKGVTTKIKLLKSKSGEAVFPGFFAGLTKEGLPFVRNNFIGSKIAFSTYELQRITKEAEAVPTKMSTSSFGTPEPESEGSETMDLNFEVNSI